MDRILLIDGLNFIYRGKISFWKGRHEFCHRCEEPKHIEKDPYHCKCGSPWHSIEHYCYGEKFGLIFNFFRNLKSIVSEFEPTKAFVVQEGHPQFRFDLYSDYKANRRVKIASDQSKSEAREKVLEDANEISRLLTFLPIIQVRHPNFEADDTISSLAENLKDEEVIVVSNDSDYIQLLQRGQENLKVYNSQKKEFMVSPPYHYLAAKSIRGDKTDNIPGLLKPKKAEEVISNPGLFETLLKQNEEFRAGFSINRQLIEFAKVPIEEIEMQEGAMNPMALKSEFERMKFQSLTNTEAWEKFCTVFEGLS